MSYDTESQYSGDAIISQHGNLTPSSTPPPPVYVNLDMAFIAPHGNIHQIPALSHPPPRAHLMQRMETDEAVTGVSYVLVNDPVTLLDGYVPGGLTNPARAWLCTEHGKFIYCVVYFQLVALLPFGNYNDDYDGDNNEEE